MKKIGIFGDYDVDGATSSAILGNYFNQIDRKTEIYIPDRKSEGYGPNQQALRKTNIKWIKINFYRRLWNFII